MPLNIPSRPRETLANPPISLALCQIRFPVSLALTQPMGLAPIQERLRDVYPVCRNEQQIIFGPSGPTGGAVVRFASEGELASVIVAPEFFALEVVEYQSWAVFSEAFFSAFRVLRDQAPFVGKIDRLGLRYVNKLRHPAGDSTPSAWTGLINPALVADSAAFGDAVVQSASDIRLREDDGVISLRSGYIGPESPLEPGEDGGYLLDLDYYDEVAPPQDEASLTACLDRWNQTLFDLFCWSLDPGFLQTLRGES